ncbi:MAG: hypothetical protein QM725_12095 [Lacibacter sp.]
MKKVTLILMSCTLLILAGCNTEKRKNFIVLVDNSTSVPEDVMQSYITTIQETILPNMGEKDKLTVQFIDACSQNKAERIYSFNLAEMDFSNKMDGVNHAADSSRARLRRYLLQTVKDELAQTIIAKRQERKSCGNYTDIVNALNEAKSLVQNGKSYTSKTDKLLNDAQGNDNYEYETCIVIFSDMVNENAARTLDFTTFSRLNDEDVNRTVTELKDLNKIPDLHGVKILVYGATSTKEAGAFAGRQIENVKLFWDLFFQSAGADLKGYGYDTEIELKQYLVDE